MDNSSSLTANKANRQPQQFKPAGLISRIAAMFYDFLLLAGLSFGYGAFALVARSLFFPSPNNTSTPNSFEQPGLIFQSCWFLLIAVFFIFFWSRGGQTLGMRAWRIQVINKDGSNISILQGIIRCCTAPMSLLFFGIGYFWCLFDKEGQTLHDKLSKSVVIQHPKNTKTQPIKTKK